jgi:hypothetical protein
MSACQHRWPPAQGSRSAWKNLMIYKSRLKTVIISAFETNGQGVERLRRDFLERDKSIQNG